MTTRTRSTQSRPLRGRRRRGFTLMEMVVVVTIIAILATLIAPNLIKRIFTAKAAAAKAGCTSIASALNLYVIDTGRTTPDGGTDLGVLLLPPSEGGGSNGPYLKKAADLIDPWGHPYVLVVPGQVNYDFDIVSFGADGQTGGDGENTDITNG